MKAALMLILALSLMAPMALAKPQWNTVNKYAADGSLCPPERNQEKACPAICVYDLGNCPHEASCPDNQELCNDGQCHDECTDEINNNNPCFCGWKSKHVPSAAKSLVPCQLTSNVTIGELYHWEEKKQVRDACASDADISNLSDFGVWKDDWPRHGTSGSGYHGVWAECPANEPQEMYTFHEPMWIAVFTILFGYVGLLGIWYGFKLIAEYFGRRRSVDVYGRRSIGNASSLSSNEGKVSPIGGDKDAPYDVDVAGAGENKGKGGYTTAVGFPSEDESENTNDLLSSDIRLSGFRNNMFGTLMSFLLLVLALLWFCYLMVISADYYGSMPGTPEGGACIYSYDDCTLNTQTFIVMWCLFVFMVVTVTVTRHHLRNFFRIKTLPHKGEFVCVEQKVESEIMLSGRRHVIVESVQLVARFVEHLLGWDWNVTTCQLHQTENGRMYFTYQCTRFVFDDEENQFAPYSFSLGEKNSDFTSKADGLTQREAAVRGELIGPNFIEVHVPNWFWAFIRQITNFIALYQLLAMPLFYYDAYWKVGIVDTAIILLAFGFGMVVRKLSEERLKRMAEQDDTLMVKRDGEWVEESTRNLVPGDVIRLTGGMHMSCDCILVSGNAIMDEASLTGEALPIRKFPVRADDTRFDTGANKNNQLYAGTIVSQVQPLLNSSGDFLTDNHVLALVRLTGTASDKGKLVRKILFPQPISFIFNEELKVVFLILVVYALFCMAMAVYMYESSPTATYFYSMFCMMQACSPLLPAGLVAGQSMAAYRLKKKKIFCVDPQRIMLAGKVQIFCFDKTGTLTKEGLEFYGVQGTDSSASDGQESSVFRAFGGSVEASSEIVQKAIASCHAVTELSGQLIGNPVDIEQFRASGWVLGKEPKYLDQIDPPANSPFGTLHVVRRFEFVHARASMSVAIQDEAAGKIHIFVKGSFERIKNISAAGSVPADYDAACSRLASEGCYVLSIAHKVFDGSIEDLRRLSQEEMESGCAFVGLLVFKNMLKPDTDDAIKELKSGSTRTVMITGDTALTGVYIARQCSMVPPGNSVLLGDIDKKSGVLSWINVDTNETVVPDMQTLLAERGADGFPTTELAVTGAAFRYLDQAGEMAPLLLNTRIFARMQPDDKVRCVKLHMERGITAMCGDGGNDCGALRASHVGLALSDAEASIVSPFASNNRSVMSCVELLLQSRAGLATSFANYRALILYGTTMTMSKLITFYHADSMSQNMWMVIDALIATSMAITVTFLPPAKKLAKYRPTARILGPEVLSSVLGVVVINWCFMACIWVWVYRQDFFRCHEFDSTTANLIKWWLLGDNYEAAILTYVVIYQFINNGFLVNYGYLYRRTWFYNPALLGIWAMLIIMMSYAELAPPSRLSCTFRINCGDPDALRDLGFSPPSMYIEPYNIPSGHNVLPGYAKWTLWGYSIGNMVAANLWQVLVVYGPIRSLLRKKRPLRRLKIKL
ncbi:hypothetical protein LPJ72_003847 [Coemansia sp. Benny D160-2]|nr:hypothetical protein LPJ72_003847 [Coemansia sp. Benny D160-2]